MLGANNNAVKNLSSKFFKFNKAKNIYKILSISITTVLLTIVSVVGLNVIKASNEYSKAIESSGSLGMETVFAIIFGVLLVSVSGYLIIYNIFYISVIKDIRIYGQLKIIGMTFKQIKKLLYTWTMKLFCVAVPIGLVIGGVIGTVIAPVLFRETIIEDYIKVEFSVIPYIIAIVFTYITVLMSIRKPSKIAGKISGIEAINYNSNDLREANKKKRKSKKLSVKRKKGAKIKNMALYNILKNKTKVIISVLSIAISSTLVVLTIIMGIGLDVKEHANRYNIRDNKVLIDSHSTDKLDKSVIDKIKNIDGIEKMDITYGVRGMSPFGMTENIDIKLDSTLLKEFSQYTNAYGISVNGDTVSAKVNGLNSEALKVSIDRHIIEEGFVDYEKFKTGKFIILNREDTKVQNGLKAGDKVELEMTIFDEVGMPITKAETFEIMAIVKNKDDNETTSNLGILTLEEQKLKQLFGENIVVSNMDFDIIDEKEKEVTNKVESLVAGTGYSQTTRQHYIDGVSGLKGSILFGTGLASLLFGAIAILNILNSTLSDLLVRKREFAMLEAIGMTKSEQRKLLRYEGMYILGLTAIFIIPLGLIAMFVAPILVPIYGGFNFVAYIVAITFVLFIIGVFVIFVPSLALKRISSDESVVERIKED